MLMMPPGNGFVGERGEIGKSDKEVPRVSHLVHIAELK